MKNLSAKLVHGNNLIQKETHPDKYRDAESRRFLREIRSRYDVWSAANLALVGPGTAVNAADGETLRQRVELLQGYKDFLDAQRYAEKFDSRSNLHSSVLEEFMFYLFKDLAAGLGERCLIGKSHSFKDMFFSPPNYGEMLRRPHAKIEIKDHDFVLGATYEASFDATIPPAETDVMGDGLEVRVEQKPADYGQVAVTSEAETHLFDVPAVAIECKTYLDKTMLEGSSRAAEEIKARNPNGLYIVVMEWIKLTDAINLQKYKVDQIYVLRKQKNTDREYRYEPGYVKNPIYPDVVTHLYETVRSHLTSSWVGGVGYGLNRGWLL